MKEKEKDTPQQQDRQTAAETNDNLGRETLEALAREKHEKQEKHVHHAGDGEGLTLKEVIQEQAIEGEAPFSRNLSLRKILGGDILNTAIIRRQIWLCMLIAFFLILYISNRYGCQQDIIEIDKLQTQLQDAKYKALSSNSQLTEKSRESNVLNLLKNNKDSALKIASQPPYIIPVPEGK